MISVLSPSYAKASNCHLEVQAFVESKSSTSGLFKILKSPSSLDQFESDVSEALANLPEFKFFERSKSGRLLEYAQNLGQEARVGFMHKVYDLAYELSHAISGVDPQVGLPGQRTIYLAETVGPLQAQRDHVRRELLEHGHTVLPGTPLSKNLDECRNQVTSFLKKADLAIHLIGNDYGFVPEGGTKSLSEIQCELATTSTASDAPMRQLFWFDSPNTITDPRQMQLLRSVREGEYTLENAELVQGSIEELKSLALKELRTTPVPASEPVLSPLLEPAARIVYIICEEPDLEAIEPLEDFLFDAGFEVKIPQFDGDADLFATMHRETLNVCDGVIVYHGKSSGQWVEMKLMDLLKAPGFGRNKPMLAESVYLAPPWNRRKERFRSQNAAVIRQEGEFDESVLKSFVDQLKSPL